MYESFLGHMQVIHRPGSSNISSALESWVLDTRGFYCSLVLMQFNEQLIGFNECNCFLCAKICFGRSDPDLRGSRELNWGLGRPREAKEDKIRAI